MNNLEKIGSGIAIAAFLFGMGAGWNAVNARFDKLEGEIKRLDEEKGESLCQVVLSRQVIAIEKGSVPIQQKLQVLAKQHCPVPANGDLVLAAHRPMTAGELAEFRAATQKARQTSLEQLEHIDRELRCSDLRAVGRAPVRPGDPGYGAATDRDGDGVGCE